MSTTTSKAGWQALLKAFGTNAGSSTSLNKSAVERWAKDLYNWTVCGVPSRIPSLRARSTRAGTEWCCLPPCLV